MEKAVRKAVFPAAGLGTRFLPATKAQPKEMLVLVDKPVIQYRRRGGRRLGPAEHRHRHRPRQERDRGSLRRGGRARELPRAARARRSSSRRSARSPGSSTCPTCGRVSHSASAMPCWWRRTWWATSRSRWCWATTSSTPTPPALKQMIDVFHRVQGPVLAVERVPPEDVSSYGDREDRRRPRPRPGRPPDRGPGREAEARGGAVQPRDHRPLHPDARHLRRAGDDRARPHAARSS